MKLEDLKNRLDVLNTKANEINTIAEKENRDLTANEAEEVDTILAESNELKKSIDRKETLAEQTQLLHAGTGRKTQPEPPAVIEELAEPGEVVRTQPTNKKLGTVPAQPRRYSAAAGNWGFNSLGDYALSVKRAVLRQGAMDQRLEMGERLAATTYGSEGVGADGGFAVPPDFRTAIMQAILAEDSLAGLCDQVSINGNNFSAPVDMTTPWQTSGGVLVYSAAEAATMTQSKPALQSETVKLNKLYALVAVTDELLDDAPSMDAYLRRKVPEKFAFKVNRQILAGGGAGECEGLLNSPALVSVAKETSQVADTLVGNNIIKMYSRMYGPSASKAVWIINQDILPQLLKLSLPGTDNTGNAVTGWGTMAYMPPSQLSGSPYGTLYGRPVIVSQAAETIGDQGDIWFVDLSQYLLLLKGGTNPRVDVSMHLWFDQDAMAYRFVLRFGGKTWWTGTASARAGSATYSPYVTLDAR